jgi:hypothetical protein
MLVTKFLFNATFESIIIFENLNFEFTIDTTTVLSDAFVNRVVSWGLE